MRILENEASGFKRFWFTSGLKKEMGDGSNTFFWFDAWLDGEPLKNRFGRLFSLSMEKEGLVSDFVVVDWKWQWRRNLFQWDRDQLDALQSLIIASGIKSDGVDRWVWMLDSSGAYSVRTTYKQLRAHDAIEEQSVFSKLWNGGVLLKVKVFGWKLFQDRIPSRQNLAWRNVQLQSVLCKGCGEEVESTYHLFFKCKLFSKVWSECLKWWGFMAPLQVCGKEHFCQFSGLLTGPKTHFGIWETI